MQKLKFYSQRGQDKMALDILNYKKNGFYIDIGANDGLTLSNTKTMEDLYWGGVCVEADFEMFKKLQENRKSINIHAAISNKTGKAKFLKISGKAQMLSGLVDSYEQEHINRIKKEVAANGDTMKEIEVDTITFDDLLNAVPKPPKVIDFVSIDVEGSEMAILKSIDFKRYDISVLAVENNYTSDDMKEYMKKQGYYMRECRNDDIFIKSTLPNVRHQNIISKIKYMNRKRIILKIKRFITHAK